MPPVSDLVRDSKLKTYITGDVTRHVIESSGRHPRQRRVRKEQTWRRAGRLGEGAFGTVWKEVLEAGESDIKARAVKVVRKRENRSKLVNYSKELEAIAKFSHPKYNSYFVESYGWFETEDAVFITMELFDHGDLQNYLWRKAEKTLPEDEVKQIALQVLEGLEHMHDNGFAHRDLKPSNILVRDPGPEWWVKIGDFGISKRAEEGMTALRTVSGTRDFMAPEIRVQDGSLFAENLADNKVYTDKVDIWSLGEIIYRALCGEGPFSKTLAAYCSHNVAFPLEALRKREISEEGCSLIQALMNVYPEERLSAKQALQHEWFANLQESSPRSSGEFPSLKSLQPNLPQQDRDTTNRSLNYNLTEASGRWTTLDGTVRAEDYEAPINQNSTERYCNQTTQGEVPTTFVDLPFERGDLLSDPKSPTRSFVRQSGDERLHDHFDESAGHVSVYQRRIPDESTSVDSAYLADQQAVPLDTRTYNPPSPPAPAALYTEREGKPYFRDRSRFKEPNPSPRTLSTLHVNALESSQHVPTTETYARNGNNAYKHNVAPARDTAVEYGEKRVLQGTTFGDLGPYQETSGTTPWDKGNYYPPRYEIKDRIIARAGTKKKRSGGRDTVIPGSSTRYPTSDATRAELNNVGDRKREGFWLTRRGGLKTGNRKKDLCVSFVRTAPEIIGEGGEFAEEPSMTIVPQAPQMSIHRVEQIRTPSPPAAPRISSHHRRASHAVPPQYPYRRVVSEYVPGEPLDRF